MRPFCPACCEWMTCEKNGVVVAEPSEPVATVRDGDLYCCRGCGSLVVTGFGKPYLMPTADARKLAHNIIGGK